MSEPIRCAVLTPAGRGAVATIRICGPCCQDMVNRYFRNLKGLARHGSLPMGRIVVGRWHSSAPSAGAEWASTQGSIAGEEVVVARTSEETIDVHCHGGQAAVQAILDGLETGGCRVVSGFDLVELANAGEIQCEARVALGKATTETVAGHVLAQYQGALHEEIGDCVKLLRSGDVSEATSRLQRLVDGVTLGLHLTTPFRVAFCGPPNVGKSSLVNALVGFERSIVFDQAGTTRDVLSVSTAIDGWPFELLDTAGLRQADTKTADGRIESAGIEMAIEHASEADLVAFVSAWDEPWTAELDRWLTQFPETLLIHNKSDLGTSRSDRPAGINSSLIPKVQIDSVLEAISQRLIGNVPPVGSPLLFTERQVHLANEALKELRSNNVPAAIVVFGELR